MSKDKYKEGFEDGAEIVAEKNRKMGRQAKKNNEEIEKCLEEMIEASRPGSFRRKKMQEVFSRYKERKVPAKYDIKIVHEGEEKYVDNIRKTLNGYGNAAFCIRAKDYRSQMSNIVDYTIFVGNIGKEVSKKKEIVLDKYGCYLAVADTQIVLMNDPASAGPRNSFLEFYKKTIKKELDCGEQSENVKKILTVRDEKTEETEKALVFLEKFSDGIIKIADKIEDKSKVARIAFTMCCFPAVLVVAFMAMPCGITEILYREISQKLKDDKYDKEMIPLAQKQILQVELCNYIKAQQIKYARVR